MKLKVCGMRNPENIEAIGALQPDLMGFIFYEKSKRLVTPDAWVLEKVWAFQGHKVGVFVNADLDELLENVAAFRLDYIQLHGDETVKYGQKLHSKGLKIIKVFGVKDQMPSKEIEQWKPYTSVFLFDTQTSEYGGSGRKFDWSILNDYQSEKPFMLSGGIGLEDIEDIKKLAIPSLWGIDVNSKFELEPGLKDVEKVKALKEALC